MSLRLMDPVLGTLELRADPYVVTSFQIGSREVRPVVRYRALQDGLFDETLYSGGRAVTLGLRLNERLCPTGDPAQTLYDRLLPYLSPRRRPVLQWEIPGSPGVIRQMEVRGESAPVIIEAWKHPTVVCSFLASGEITSPVVKSTTIIPSLDVEAGRPYDLAFDRNYPASLGPGDRLLVNEGNERAHWSAVISGIATNPTLTINGIPITWTQVLVGGDTISIDSKERTMFFNNDVTEPRFHVTNYTTWSWDDVMLEPGPNSVRFSATSLGLGGAVTVTWSDHWAG